MTGRPWTATVVAVLAGLGGVLLTGCASVPQGPDVAVMPAPGMPYAVFRRDDARCRAYASRSVGARPSEVAANSTASGAIIGAAAGAFLGSLGSPHGDGAANGAISGMLVGGSVGAANGQAAAATLQHRYDIAYEQCMYASGDSVPQARERRRRRGRSWYPPPPPPSDDR
ncbi:MAG TPA: glycine zipper family protein [Gammaproteobacteria bacterium]|nr:glycine zipper family protein [Gammaproteobacteria bacterium]